MEMELLMLQSVPVVPCPWLDITEKISFIFK